tara:strand:- start:108 stop:476 length:369 start_codon:yes stop_codon:yes gene_type:complete
METNLKQWQKSKQIDAQIGSELYSFIVPISYIKLLDKAGSVEREAHMLLSDKSIYNQFNSVCQKDSYEYFMNCGIELEEIESLYNWKRSDLKYLIWLILSDELERIREEEEESKKYQMLFQS